MSTQALDGLRRPGWLTFAAVVLVSVGCLRIISAIYYFADSTRVNNLSGGAFGHHLFLWGLWDLLIALLALWGGFSLFGGNTFGRVIGYIWAILVKAGLPRYAEIVSISDDPGEAAASYFILKMMGYPDVKVLVM